MPSSLASLGLLVLLAASASADFSEGDDRDFFEKKVRPVLIGHCYPCHSLEAGKQKGGLTLDTREGLRKGGDRGPALVPGDPDASLLLQAVRHTREELKMPPRGKLPDAIVADLETWVKRGAPDPRTKAVTPTAATPWEETLRARRHWWSLQPVRERDVPPVQHPTEPGHPVDRFLAARLEEAGLTPAPPADRRTLIRRLSLVLVGLPPTADEVEGFLRDDSPFAYERLVDRLLGSPHFGERWARHWMDVVRFSETHGNEWNYEVHHAWRYRDYLIRAFNEDVPYDRFVREHIAGDLLPPRWNTAGCNESVIGTAFYRFGEANHDDCIALRQIGFDIADGQIDTLTKAFQATTVACARCHDHKLDAVSMQDYYALLGILRSSRLVSHTLDAPDVNAQLLVRLRELKAGVRKELGDVWIHDARVLHGRLMGDVARPEGLPSLQQLARRLDVNRPESWLTALKAEKLPPEHPLAPWRSLASVSAKDPAVFAAQWRKLAEEWAREDREREKLNAARFHTIADFRHGDFAGWQAGGHGLRERPTPSGDFVLQPEGETLVKAVLPAGCFTHTLSDKLNGTLRSPVLALGNKHISFQVMGEHSSAVRLVSNNCQLNYRNYRALTDSTLQWVTFPPPEDGDFLRVYAELMTIFDNPKFPDQLSALGGDKANYRLPWVGSSRVDLQACKLEYSIVSPK